MGDVRPRQSVHRTPSAAACVRGEDFHATALRQGRHATTHPAARAKCSKSPADLSSALSSPSASSIGCPDVDEPPCERQRQHEANWQLSCWSAPASSSAASANATRCGSSSTGGAARPWARSRSTSANSRSSADEIRLCGSRHRVPRASFSMTPSDSTLASNFDAWVNDPCRFSRGIRGRPRHDRQWASSS